MASEKNTSESRDINGMDVIIVSTGDESQEIFWQNRLTAMRGILYNKDAIVLAVNEDWPGGAGNGLGTLYAYHKAQEKAQLMYQCDLYELQKQGASVAIYHTAGIGKRLFPLTASESNNKSAVKLPGLFNNEPISILESVILQTAQFAKHRGGRLSVFWSDQLFIPEEGYRDRPNHHVEILGQVQGTLASLQKGPLEVEQYGLLTQSASGQVRLLEKVGKMMVADLVKSNKLSDKDLGAISLGSFSLSSAMTFALLREFTPEIERKDGKLDSDPHFWMPLTLDLETYLTVMSKHSIPKKELRSHYARMDAFKQRFFQCHSDTGFFGLSNIGKKGFWWDFGSTRSYYQNILKLASPDTEGQASRLFFQLEPNKTTPHANRVIKDEHSSLINCNIQSGRITNSVLIGVNAKSIEADRCVIINSDFTTLAASGSLLYHVKEEAEVSLPEGTVRADAQLPETGEHLKIYSFTDRNGKDDWELTLPHNPGSYKEICEKIEGRVN